MANERLVVLQSLPTAEVVIDGETYDGFAMTGTFVVDSRMAEHVLVPTITAGAYATGDAIGGLLEFEDVVDSDEGGAVTVDAMIITDKGKQSANLELALFTEEFTPTADNAAFDVDDAELGTYAGSILTASSWSAFNDNSANTQRSLNQPVVLVGTSLWGQLISRGTPTYASTSDIRIKLVVRHD